MRGTAARAERLSRAISALVSVQKEGGVPERDPYDPDVQLENDALLFLERGSLTVAIALFGYLGDRRPHHSPLWYGLGNGLARLAWDQRSRRLLELAIAALRRSLREDPDNPLSPQLLDLLRDRSGLPPSSFAVIPAYEESPLGRLPTVGFSPDALVEATLGLPDGRRHVSAPAGHRGRRADPCRGR